MKRPPVTLSQALDDEHDILQALSFPEKRLDFACELFTRFDQIQSIVANHLCVPESACRMPAVQDWIHGSFNMCLPVIISGEKIPQRKVMIRFPLPYKNGEAVFPGNVEEKLRCEVAAYAWIQDHCPSIPIPRLFGYKFSSESPSVCLCPSQAISSM